MKKNKKLWIGSLILATTAGSLFNLMPSIVVKAENEKTQSVEINNKGDITLDNKITLADAQLGLLAALGIEELTAKQKEAADLYDEGKVTLKNVNIILREALGIEMVDMAVYGLEYVLNKNLSIDVVTDKQVYYPEEEMKLTITVKNNGTFPIEIGASTGMFGEEGCIQSYLVTQEDNIIVSDGLLTSGPVTDDVFWGKLAPGDEITVERTLPAANLSYYKSTKQCYIDVALTYVKEDGGWGQYHSKVPVTLTTTEEK